MLTPNEITDRLDIIDAKVDKMSDDFFSKRLRVMLTINLYQDVLEEIARGSIDPKSLAYAALRPRK